MKTTRHLLIFATALALLLPARAQLEVSMKLPYTTFLQCEAIPAVVTIHNNTAFSIPSTGPNGYTLLFDIKDAEGQPVLAREGRTPEAPTLPPGATLTITNDLLSIYRIIETRQASITASADYRGTSYTSKKEFIDIQEGAELTRIRTTDATRTLTHTLRTLLRTGHEHLFLRVDDETAGNTYGATDLGTLLRNNAPQIMLDRTGNTHILHRSTPEQFAYHTAAPDGTLLKHERFIGDYKLVRLIATDDGQIICNGLPAEKTDRPQMLQQTPFRPDLHRDTKPR